MKNPKKPLRIHLNSVNRDAAEARNTLTFLQYTEHGKIKQC